MSNQQRDQSKAETKTEKKTDATAILSPEELRAISGGAQVQQPPTGPGTGGVGAGGTGH
jgi:hypothetical protein